MKSILNALKAARMVEVLVLIAAISTLLVIYIGNSGQQSGLNDDEKRLKRILSEIDGAGNISVMVSGNTDEDNYSGIVVVMDGDDSMITTLRIQRAVQILTGLDLEYIEVVNAG